MNESVVFKASTLFEKACAERGLQDMIVGTRADVSAHPSHPKERRLRFYARVTHNPRIPSVSGQGFHMALPEGRSYYTPEDCTKDLELKIERLVQWFWDLGLDPSLVHNQEQFVQLVAVGIEGTDAERCGVGLAQTYPSRHKVRVSFSSGPGRVQLDTRGYFKYLVYPFEVSELNDWIQKVLK